MLTPKQLRFENCSQWRLDSSDIHESLILYKASRAKKTPNKPKQTNKQKPPPNPNKQKPNKESKQTENQTKKTQTKPNQTQSEKRLLLKDDSFVPRNAFCNLKPLHPKLYTGPIQNEDWTVTRQKEICVSSEAP